MEPEGSLSHSQNLPRIWPLNNVTSLPHYRHTWHSEFQILMFCWPCISV